jgi:hypothetical protein
VVHRRSTVYYPQGNGLAESTNNTLQKILRKIVEANRTDWDCKLHSAVVDKGCQAEQALASSSMVEVSGSGLMLREDQI